MNYTTLNKEFLQAMEEIGQYGLEKYGSDSFAGMQSRNDRKRNLRIKSHIIGDHVKNHYDMYLNGEKHDRFNTFKHQLAAVAFNAMMEFYFANLDSEESLAKESI
jgi:hypothetical protein